jgi:hypothetical protein
MKAKPLWLSAVSPIFAMGDDQRVSGSEHTPFKLLAEIMFQLLHLLLLIVRYVANSTKLARKK